MHTYQKVDVKADRWIAEKIRDANLDQFSKIPDILAVEKALTKGRFYRVDFKQKVQYYRENFIGSLAKWYDTHGYLTSPETGAKGAGQLGKLREIYLQENQEKKKREEERMIDAGNSEWVGSIGSVLTIEVEFIAEIKYRNNRKRFPNDPNLLSIFKFKDMEGNIHIYNGNSGQVQGLQVGSNYSYTVKIRDHRNYNGVRQTVWQQPVITSDSGLEWHNRLKGT